MKLKHDSLWLTLASYGSSWSPENLCELFWSCVRGFFVCLLFTAFGIAAGLVFLLDPILHLYACWLTGGYTDFTIFGFWPWPVAVGAVAAGITGHAFQDRMRYPREPSVIGEMYRGFKERYCPTIEVVR